MITIFAPDGIGEVTQDTDLAGEIIGALASDPHGPLRDGDIVVVTSKIISKLEGCVASADDKPAVLDAETRRTVVRRGRFAIVETRHGLVQAAAGIDNSNVAAGVILTLPPDPDASARRLHEALTHRCGVRIGVIISDTAGRTWRIGQTDHAIGLYGVRGVLRYEGVTDGYGNPLQVTAMAVADEIAAAADLAKTKLAGRPVAVVRGLPDLVIAPATDRLTDLIRPVGEDLFRLGSRESVIEALAAATGDADRAEQLFRLDPDALAETLAAGLGAEAAQLVRAMVEHASGTAPDGPGVTADARADRARH